MSKKQWENICSQLHKHLNLGGTRKQKAFVLSRSKKVSKPFPSNDYDRLKALISDSATKNCLLREVLCRYMIIITSIISKRYANSNR